MNMPGWLTAIAVLHGGCTALYLVLSALVLAQGRLSRSGRLNQTGRLFAVACLATAAWAAAVAGLEVSPLNLLSGPLDVLRAGVWCGFILHLYLRAVRGSQQRSQIFLMLGLIAVLVVAVIALLSRGSPGSAAMLWYGEVVARLGVAVCSVLLIENLYLNTPEDARWHISLPCIALGALAIYDIAISADALLFRRVSLVLFDGRALATAIVAPLLAVAAARNRSSWGVDIHVSRAAVFHSATLVASGIFLLGLVVAGETFRYIGGTAWGGVAEISLIFAGLVTIAVLLTSRSTRSRLRGVLIDNFFSHRYDYRREWMRCIATLSAQEEYVALHTRVIRALAEVVDSPAGVLFLRERGEHVFQWAGSWNMAAASAPILPEHPLVAAFRDGNWIVEAAPFQFEMQQTGIANAWLVVPLNHNRRLIGLIVVARPRAEFKLDREVFDLLRVIGRQVATYVAEQRATEGLIEARQLHEYGKRFAFVAHDIKNVSSQLSLLLSNAETHLANPEFQRDMLATIRAAVQKIGALIKRLSVPEGEPGQTVLRPGERLAAITASIRRLRGAPIDLSDDGVAAGVSMAETAFDAVVTHLLNNAIEAATAAAVGGEPEPVRIVLRHEARHALIDIVDTGPGMAPEFVRDDLFRPFRTSKVEGSGIGAYQARELVRSAGGDLIVLSRPGEGTTMRLILPLVETAVRQAIAASA
jgi:putative PEP-CTERM system histidine kinase